ncbi:hypothetical protein [Streptococcus thoraltensis]|nr:hypothetical protein [Streptococcus thoraltensis]QBX31141.1 hypothetical protein Javan616_0048 [Streptococcus phage Javan616]
MFNKKTRVQKAFMLISKFIDKADISEQEKTRLKNLLLNVKTYSGVM